MIHEISNRNLTERCSDDCDNEVLFLHKEEDEFRFCPVTEGLKRELCNELGIPYTQTRINERIEVPSRALGQPCASKQINGDGNCFFRAISYSLSYIENHHIEIRSAICTYILENENVFKTFLRSNDSSVKSHVSLMMQKEKWATELEILALAHMLRIDVFTYSDGRWLKFSGQIFYSSLHSKAGRLYLDHKDGNQYDVVIDVAEPFVDVKNNLKKNLKTKEIDDRKGCTNKRESILQYKREKFTKNTTKMQTSEIKN